MSRFNHARVVTVISWLDRMRQHFHSPVFRYGITVSYWLAVTAFILAFRLTFEQSALLLVWPAVILTTWLGGFASGLVASAAALITLSYLVSFPYHVIHTDPEFTISVGAFLLSVCLVAMIRSKQRRVEMALRLSQQQTLAILETVSDPFYGLDRSWRFTYANAAAERLWGRPREALIGKSIWEEFPKDIESPTYREMHGAMWEQCARRFETYSDSLSCWVEMNLYPSGQGLSVYLRDITDRKRAQERTAVLQKVTACFPQIPEGFNNFIKGLTKSQHNTRFS